MDAPLRSDSRSLEKSHAAETRPTQPTERVTDTALQKIKMTTDQLIEAKPLLAAFIKPRASLEENFFHLADTIHFLAKINGTDEPPRGTEWESDHLLKIAKRLTLPIKSDKLYQFINKLLKDPKDVKKTVEIVIQLAERLPEAQCYNMLNKAYRLLVYRHLPTADFELEIINRYPLKKIQDVFPVSYNLGMMDHEKAASLVHAQPPSQEQAEWYAEIAAQLIKKGESQKAYPYLEEAAKGGPNVGYLSLSSLLFQHPSLPQLPLEAILYTASKLKPEFKTRFLLEVSNLLWDKHQYEDVFAVLDAVSPGQEKDKKIEEFLRNPPSPAWVKPALARMISDPAKRINLTKKL